MTSRDVGSRLLTGIGYCAPQEVPPFASPVNAPSHQEVFRFLQCVAVRFTVLTHGNRPARRDFGNLGECDFSRNSFPARTQEGHPLSVECPCGFQLGGFTTRAFPRRGINARHQRGRRLHFDPHKSAGKCSGQRGNYDIGAVRSNQGEDQRKHASAAS